MPARPPRKRTTARRQPESATHVPAAEFKATCLELLDRVRETGVDYVVTKRGKPVARVVPYRATHRASAFFGSMKGSVLRYDRPFDPVDGEYDMDKPLGSGRGTPSFRRPRHSPLRRGPTS
jgi:prevent-host-death family protein